MSLAAAVASLGTAAAPPCGTGRPGKAVAV